MNESKLKNLLMQAAVDLYKNQPNINQFTSETNNTEWNLAHHYANEIQKRLSIAGYHLDCDLDVSKPNLEYKRPDMIFHKRGVQEHNFLVIEIKRNSTKVSAEDISKIEQCWLGSRLHYQFGAAICLCDSGKHIVKMVKNKICL